jgi:diguanylate cyclase (GGDEF)-like protein/PAS domain S-box-containing protein
MRALSQLLALLASNAPTLVQVLGVGLLGWLVGRVGALARREHGRAPLPVLSVAEGPGSRLAPGWALGMRQQEGTPRGPVERPGGAPGAAAPTPLVGLSDPGLAPLLFRHSEHPILLTDARDRIVAVNDAACRVLGYGAEWLQRRALLEISALTADAPDPAEVLAALRSHGEWRGNLWLRRHTGEPLALRSRRVALRDGDGRITGFLTFGRDLAAAADAGHMTTWLAQHDPLTKLPNRSFFRQRLTDVLQEPAPDVLSGAVVSLDLDRFKQVNDTLGHGNGDELLVQVAHRLALALRDTDTVARIGSDEFAVIMREVEDVTVVERFVRDVMEALSQPFAVPAAECVIGVSVGVALFTMDGEDADELMRNADAAMHEAKALGGGTWKFFEHAVNEEVARRLTLENRLRAAVRANAFTLHYQPILSVDGSEVIGAEALCRWHDPVLGHVSPGEFIPVAETCGLIVPMGRWILEEACRQATAWKEAGLPPLRISVNVSSRQLRHDEDAAALLALIGRYDPEWLTIEITESTLMHDVERTSRFFDAARAMGARIALDDFGTGYSSLGYLRNYRIDTLKIDKSFVDHIEESNSDLSLVATIISMGRTLGMKTVAEGVENEHQIAYLATLGCDYVQGYHYCRPLPAPEAEAFFQDRCRRN